MPAAKYAATRTDGRYIGKAIREIVRLIVHEGMFGTRRPIRSALIASAPIARCTRRTSLRIDARSARGSMIS